MILQISGQLTRADADDSSCVIPMALNDSSRDLGKQREMEPLMSAAHGAARALRKSKGADVHGNASKRCRC